MSLWKVMTMSQVARQGAQAYEAQAAGRFVWGKEGFKWMSDSTSSSQDNSSECSSSSEHKSQFSTSHEGVTAGRYNSSRASDRRTQLGVGLNILHFNDHDH